MESLRSASRSAPSLPATPRFLTSFHPKRISHQFCDVLIIGSGLAGLRAAAAVDPGQSVMIVTKEETRQSNSQYAQGGIAGVVGPDDRFEDHVADTLKAGGDLCDREIVKMVIEEAPNRIDELTRWGTEFDTISGRLALGREGGHSRQRVVHAMGDATGQEVIRAIVEHVQKMSHVDLLEETITLDLLTHQASCRGALLWNAQRGMTMAWAKQTILCTGGTGQIYRETTNPSVATADGHAMAYRAGAELRDMEFMQFHPTVLYIAGSSRSLITEAVRGEGAQLVDRDGYRFMPEYDERAELASRDIVSQAIVNRMEKTHHPNVYLDLSHLDADYIHSRFPNISARCREFGLDIARDRIPVRPGAHYMLGGVTVDRDGRTSLPGLWAAGEVTSSGLHGANRLASNSLLEALVFGAHAGAGASLAASEIVDDFRALPIENQGVPESAEMLDLGDIRNSLTSLMWRMAGVRRCQGDLEEASRTIDQWCGYVLARQFENPAGWELQNMLLVARMVVGAALARKESRGVHDRSDYPKLDQEKWNCHLTLKRES